MHIQNDCDKVLEDYKVKAAVDALHSTVKDAKTLKANGQTRNDVWQEDLSPADAVAARTVPILEAELQRLRQRWQKVC